MAKKTGFSLLDNMYGNTDEPEDSGDSASNAADFLRKVRAAGHFSSDREAGEYISGWDRSMSLSDALARVRAERAEEAEESDLLTTSSFGSKGYSGMSYADLSEKIYNPPELPVSPVLKAMREKGEAGMKARLAQMQRDIDSEMGIMNHETESEIMERLRIKVEPYKSPYALPESPIVKAILDKGESVMKTFRENMKNQY